MTEIDGAVTLAYYQRMLKEPDTILFLRGACHVFAFALQDRFGYLLRVVYDPSKPMSAIHVYGGYSNGRGVDVAGLFNESELLHSEGWASQGCGTKDIAKDDLLLQYATTVAGDGLFHPDFIKEARPRAEKLIDEYPDHYSGKNPQPVPGITRSSKGDWRRALGDGA